MTRNKKKKLSIRQLVLPAAAIVAVVTGVTMLWPTESQRMGDIASDVPQKKVLPLVNRANKPSVAHEKIEEARSSITNRTALTKRRIRFAPVNDNEEDDWTDEQGQPWPEEQKQLMRAINLASRNDDFNALADLSAQVLDNANDEIRERFVTELGWFGEEALPELLAFMSDKNEDVATTAREQWLDGVQSIESDAEKAVLLTMVSKAMTDSDALEMFADELIGMDELLAMQTIVDAIEIGTPQAAKAVKTVYETITGEEWSDVGAAENWLQENYVDTPAEEETEKEPTDIQE